MNRTLTLLLSALLCTSVAAQAAPATDCADWPAWNGFRTRFLDDGGRIIDPAVAQRHSTSEGQSYGLFFALVANDQASFARILRWIEDNLAGGDLTARLPAWQWGKRADDSWGVIDDNPASDSDVWIAYALAEAGRLWKVQKYTALAELLAERILREETIRLPGLGRTLLPAPRGFQPQPGVARLNPSYAPIQVLRRLSVLYPKSEWKQVVTTSIDTIVRSAPRGFAPDWVLYKADGGFQPDPDSRAVGSFNAIRVYLWAGMQADTDAVRTVLLKTLAPMARYVGANGMPPLETDTRQGSASGVAPAGFSAALLPFLAASRQTDALRQQRLRVEAKSPLERSDNYYEQVLTLFGTGWIEQRYRFARDGALIPRWTCGG